MKTTNYIPQVAEMLGIKIGEEFDIYVYGENKNCFSPYHFTEVDLLDKKGNSNCYVLAGILNGTHTIKKASILDGVEKRYLENVIRPFRDKVLSVEKRVEFIPSYIVIKYIEEDCNIYSIPFPPFEKGTMYNNMEPNKKYTLKELGLFEDE